MSIQRKKLEKELLKKLCEKYSPSERFSNFDINNVYIDYTEEEKSRNVTSIVTNNIVPNEFFICYTYKDELYFLVRGDEDFTDDNITKYQSNIIDLLIMQKENSLRVNASLTSNESPSLFAKSLSNCIFLLIPKLYAILMFLKSSRRT